MKLRDKSPIRRRVKRRLIAMPKKTVSTRFRAQLNDEQLQARQEKAMVLRIDEGKTFEEIGRELGVSVSTARKDCKAIAALKYEGMIEKDDMVILESNARYDHIMSVWLPKIKALADGELLVGETRKNRDGSEYDITIPEFESAKTATEMVLKTLRQREALNGFLNPKTSDKSPNEIGGEIATQVLMRMMEIARRPVQAHIVDEDKQIQHAQGVSIENGQIYSSTPIVREI